MPFEDNALIATAVGIGYTLLGLALLCGFFRLVKGPSSADRIVALDLIAGIALATTVLLAIDTRQSVYLNVAVCIALFAFLGTVAFARYLERTDS